jgi:hypothetical protein
MGTVSSMSKDRTLKVSESMDESTEYDFKLNFLKNNHNITNSYQQSETAEKTKMSELNETVPYTFEWKEGGNNVQFCSSFLEDWKRKEPMKFNKDTNSFEVTLNVPKGKHQFKFIVNGIWVCSKNYKINNDNNNNINNEIEINIENNTTKNINNTIKDAKKIKKKQQKGNKDYNCVYPNKSSINPDAPNIPMFFNTSINLNYNSNQLNLNLDSKLPEQKDSDGSEENKLSLKFDQTKTILENDTFKSITTIPHEKLLHIFTHFYKNDNYIRSAVTQRNKHKFLTLVYFSPK